MTCIIHLSPDSSKAESVVNILKMYGVKLLAFDFDMTLVDIDTAGIHKPKDLDVKHLRPCFRSIIPAAIQIELQTCVVTYNQRKALVAGVLESAFPTYDIDDKIPIEVFSKPAIGSSHVSVEAARYGKERHIKRVLKRLKKQSGQKIEPYEIFLFDDYEPNIEAAIKSQHLTFKVRHDVTLDDILLYVEGLSRQNRQILDRQNAEKYHAVKSDKDEENGGNTSKLGHKQSSSLVSRIVIQTNTTHERKDGGLWNLKSSHRSG